MWSKKRDKNYFAPIALALTIAALNWETVRARNLLRSAPQICPIEFGNLIDVKLFVKDNEECFKHCEVNEHCRYYR